MSRRWWWVALVAAPIILTVGEAGFVIAGFAPLQTFVLDLAVGITSIAVGLILWWRFPDNKSGLLLYLVGGLWALGGLGAYGLAWTWVFVFLITGAHDMVLAHLFLAYPDGRLETRPARIVVAGVYSLAILNLVLFFFVPSQPCPGCVNPLPTIDSPTTRELIDTIALVGSVVAIVASVTIVVSRFARSGPLGRRIYGPVMGVAVLFGLVLFVETVVVASGDFEDLRFVLIATAIARLLIPVAFMGGMLQTTIDRASVVGLVVGLERVGPGARIEALLAEHLHDPSLRLAYWADSSGGFVDGEGLPVDVSDQRQISTVVEGNGHPLAVITHDPALQTDPARIEAAVAATRMVIEREALQTQVRAQLEEMRESRARIVEATETERRRIERDLHDGVQQRLLALGLELRILRGQTTEPGLAAALEEAERDTMATLVELRDLAQGIYPAILTSEGLGPAVEVLGERSPVSVTTSIEATRLPASVEAAAYFVVSEALTNVIKHAGASRVEIDAVVVDGALRMVISDDGVGGASPNGGTGLNGIADRVSACEGKYELVSPAGHGTTLTVDLPVGTLA